MGGVALLKGALNITGKIFKNKPNLVKDLTLITKSGVKSSNKLINGKTIAAATFVGAGSATIISANNYDNIEFGDTFKSSSNYKTEKQLRNEAYAKIEEYCNRVGISIEAAKKLNLLEKIAGVNNFEEFMQLSPDEIDEIISSIDHSFSLMNNFMARIKSFLTGNDLQNISDINELIKDARNIRVQRSVNIDFIDKVKFKLFAPDMEKEIRKYIPKDINKATPEDYDNAIDMFIKNRYGDVSKLSNDDYIKLKKEIYLYLTNDNITTVEERALSSASKNFDANERVKYLKDYVSCGPLNNVSPRARYAEQAAKFVLLSPDRFGNYVSQSDAITYHYITFNNMDANGIKESLSEMNDYSSKVEAEYKNLIKLKSQGKLTQAQSIKLAELELAHNNMVVAATAGSMVGIAGNININSAQASEFLNQACDIAYMNNIQNEVFKLAKEFISNNQNITSSGNIQFDKLLDKITNGEYSKIINDSNIPYELRIKLQNIINQTKSNIDDLIQENAKSKLDDDKLVAKNSDNSKDIATRKNEHKINHEDKVVTSTDNKHNEADYKTTYSTPISKKNNSNNTLKPISEQQSTIKYSQTEFNNALTSIDKFNKFIEKYSIPKVESYAMVLNNDKSSNVLQDYILSKIKTLNAEEQTIAIVKIKNNKFKKELAKNMSTRDIKNAENNTNFYTTQVLEDIIRSKMDSNNLCH